MSDSKWWEKAIIYQVYPYSFQDTDGDGTGDLKGILNRMDYIESLGVNTLWINPIVESPQDDNGYDVSDYYKIDSLFGSNEEWEQLIDECHNRGLKIIWDFPLNHTSVEHPWFKEAIKGPGNPYRDFYIFADAQDGKKYPNNWSSNFGGSAWTKEPNGDQFYLHLFKESMPDLNWKNPDVEKEMVKIAKYWDEKGVDGIRLDAFMYMAKADGLPDDGSVPEGALGSGEKMNQHQPDIHNYLQAFSDELHDYDSEVFVVGEAATADTEIAKQYITRENNDTVDKIITFVYFPEKDELKDPRLPAEEQSGELDLKKFKTVMSEWQKELPHQGGTVLYWGNHDMPRLVSRFGDDTRYRDNSSKMLATLMYLQKGLPFLYYGEEIGMKNSSFDDVNEVESPGSDEFYKKATEELGYSHEEAMQHINNTGRSIARNPMQWEDSPYAGFSTSKPWTKWNQEKKYNVKDQEKDEHSILHYYRALLKLKKLPLFTDGDFTLKDSKETMYIYQRTWNHQKAIVYCNFSEHIQQLTGLEISEDEGSIWLQNEENNFKKDRLTLSPYGTVVIVNEK